MVIRFMLFDSMGVQKAPTLDLWNAVRERTIGDSWKDSFQADCAGTVDKGMYIVFEDYDGWCEYRVTAPDDIRQDAGPSGNIQAVNSVQELDSTSMFDERGFHETGIGVRRAAEVCINGTRWYVGDLDETDEHGTRVLHDVSFDPGTGGWTALQQVAKTWGLEISTTIRMESTRDSVGQRYVNLTRHRGSTTPVSRFEYSADLKSVRRTFDAREPVTRLYAFGKTVKDEANGTESPVTVEPIIGKPYIDADPGILDRWGVAGPDGDRRPLIGSVSYTDIEDPGALYDKALEQMKTLSAPSVSYEAEVTDIPGMDESLTIGDAVQVIDTSFTPDLRLEARAIGIKQDLVTGSRVVTLGSIVESLAEKQTIITRTAQTVAEGKPVWDAASGIADAAHSTATDAYNEATGLSERVDSAVSSATAAQTTATAAQTAATAADSTAKAAAAQVALVGGMTDVTFTVAEFGDGLSVTKAVTNLPASMVAGAPPVRAQQDLWGVCQPIVLDHDSDESIPAGSIRVDVKSKPTADLTVRLAALKGATA